jgi:hypothetical protein
MNLTGMPTVSEGRTGLSTPFTGRLEPQQELIIDAGINLFELQKPKINPAGTQDFGPFGVSVTNPLDPDGRVFINVEWLMGDRAYLKYYPERKNGVCFGFLPDDPWWFNRIWLASNRAAGLFIINRYITQNGLLPGSEISSEIKFIEEYIHDWKVVVGKEVMFRSKSLPEATEKAREIAEKTGKRSQLIFAKIEEIERARSDNRHAHWIMSDDLQNGIIKRLKAAVDEKFGAAKKEAGSVNIAAEIEKYIGGLNSAALLDLMSKAKEKDVARSIEGKTLKDLNFDESKMVAKTYGIDAKNLNERQIKREISKKSGIKFELDEDTVPDGNKKHDGVAGVDSIDFK